MLIELGVTNLKNDESYLSNAIQKRLFLEHDDAQQ